MTENDIKELTDDQLRDKIRCAEEYIQYKGKESNIAHKELILLQAELSRR
jgi:hypothetical protein